MALKKQVTLAQIRVGIFVSIALLLAAVLIVGISWRFDIFADVDQAKTYLPNVGGLQPGAPVWLAGIEIGTVRKVAIVPPEVFEGNEPISRRITQIQKEIDALDRDHPNYSRQVSDKNDRIRNLKTQLRFVEVQLELKRPHLNQISRDSEVTIESKGLIGDSFIDISPGTYNEPPPKRGEFYVIEGRSVAGFREILTGANDVIANFGVLSDQFKDIAFKINPDEVGESLATTIVDLREALQRATDTFGEANLLLQDLRTGPGTIGRLVSDPALHLKIEATLQKLQTLTEEIQSGSGTLAKLISEPQLYDNANATLQKADVMMTRIAQGQGTLGKLSTDPALYETSQRALDKIANMVELMDRAQGTMGKLLHDPSLYDNLNQSTAEISKLLYDIRQDPKKFLTFRFRLF